MKVGSHVGKHLYRVKFSFHSDGMNLLLSGSANILTDKRGLQYAGPTTTAMMKRPAFRNRFPDAIVRDIIYLGVIDA